MTKPFSNQRKSLVRVVLAVVLAGGICLVAVPARAGVADIIQFLQTINSTLRNGIGLVLSEIRTVENTVNTIHEQIVWPLNLINQAKASVTGIIGQYRGLMNQIHTIEVQSASLVSPSHLEAELRSATRASLNNIQPAYVQVYSPLPQPTAAAPPERNMIDMADASAVGSLKTASLADQTSSHILTIADNIEQQAAVAAPGSAPFLAAQAQVAQLEAQAYQAKLLAAELRAEATQLAHDNALLKRSASHTSTFRLQMQQMLK